MHISCLVMDFSKMSFSTLFLIISTDATQAWDAINRVSLQRCDSAVDGRRLSEIVTHTFENSISHLRLVPVAQ